MIHLSSLTKKYLMAVSGFVMVAFVFVHMIGNLRIFAGADAINKYSHLLQTLPFVVLWGFRSFLILSVVVHVWMAILLTKENRAARPKEYAVTNRVQATLASRTMGISGSIILFFIVFHLLHYTQRVIFPEFKSAAFHTLLDGHKVYNVYKMMVVGFSETWVSILYIVCMALLCMHLTHAVWSMFQTMGWCNKNWRTPLKRFAWAYGWIIFLGFSAIPVAVLAGYLKPHSESEMPEAVVINSASSNITRK